MECQGLFHRTILQSGSALCDWSVEKNPSSYAQSVAVGLQCPTDPAAMVSCLMKKDPQQLILLQIELLVDTLDVLLLFNVNAILYFNIHVLHLIKFSYGILKLVDHCRAIMTAVNIVSG